MFNTIRSLVLVAAAATLFAAAPMTAFADPNGGPVGKVAVVAAGDTKVYTVTLNGGESTRVRAEGRDVALFLIGGRYFALADACPHMGASLSAGWVGDGIVTCPLHFWRFRLDDGTWADNPRLKTDSFDVRVVGEEIQVELPDC